LSSFFSWLRDASSAAEIRGFARIFPSGSPVIETNVKIRKLVASSTGML